MAQMRQIQSAERTVPVGTVALAAIQLRARLPQWLVDLVPFVPAEALLQPAADDHHPCIHLVGFRILHPEIAPETAAHETAQRRPSRVVLHLLGQALELEQSLGGQNPLGHFTLQPAVFIDVFLGFRPGAELLAVVAESDHGRGMLARPLGQVFDRLFRIAEGNQVAQPFAAGKDRQHAAFVLGGHVAGKLPVFQAGGLEVEIVQDGVFHAGIHQVARKRLFPDAFGHPHAAHRHTETLLQAPAKSADLALAVAGGNHGQNRLVVGPADDLHPAPACQLAHPVQILGVICFEPLEQRPAQVQGDAQRLEPRKHFEKGTVAVFVGLAKDVVEVADRLVIMQGEDQSDGLWHDGSSSLRQVDPDETNRPRLTDSGFPHVFRRPKCRSRLKCGRALQPHRAVAWPQASYL